MSVRRDKDLYRIHKKIHLNSKQVNAYSLMRKGQNVFLTGPGGVGKSALLRLFMRTHQHSHQISVTSAPDVNAWMRKIEVSHPYLGEIPDLNGISSNVQFSDWLIIRLKSVSCLIIDEISRMDPILFDKLDKIARVIRKNTQPFGGIQLILSGDFLQLPCIKTDHFCFQSQSWKACGLRTIYLDEIIRQQNKNFQLCLNHIRFGNITEKVKSLLESRRGIKLKNNHGIIPTYLYSEEKEANRINNEELDKLAKKDNRQFYEYRIESLENSVKCDISEKFRHICLPPQVLQLCIDAQVILLKNLDPFNGLTKGSRGIVVSFLNEMPIVRFLNGYECLIDWEIWEIRTDEKLNARVRQLPLNIAYALSIHLSQGCSLDYTQIDLTKIRGYGHAYVALSRVKRLQGLSIIRVDYKSIRAHPLAVSYYQNLNIDGVRDIILRK